MGILHRLLSLPRRMARALARRFRSVVRRLWGIDHIEEQLRILHALQTSALQAAVHLIEVQQALGRDLPDMHTQVLRRLVELRRQLEALRPAAGANERRAA
jgi:hypothetical protein